MLACAVSSRSVLLLLLQQAKSPLHLPPRPVRPSFHNGIINQTPPRVKSLTQANHLIVPWRGLYLIHCLHRCTVFYLVLSWPRAPNRIGRESERACVLGSLLIGSAGFNSTLKPGRLSQRLRDLKTRCCAPVPRTGLSCCYRPVFVFGLAKERSTPNYWGQPRLSVIAYTCTLSLLLPCLFGWCVCCLLVGWLCVCAVSYTHLTLPTSGRV